MAAVEASAGRVGIWVEVVVLNNSGKGNGCSKHVELSDFHGEVGISTGPSNLRFTVRGSAAMKASANCVDCVIGFWATTTICRGRGPLLFSVLFLLKMVTECACSGMSGRTL